MTSFLIEIENLQVQYGNFVAVDNVSLCIPKGQIVGLLGPNGAGKSTTLSAVAGQRELSGGNVLYKNAPIADNVAVRKKLGFAGQPPFLYDFFTLQEHVEFVENTRTGSTSHTPAVLESLGLTNYAQRFCRELSYGLKQRASLAAAIVGDVECIFLDETLNGLDPYAARLARQTLHSLANNGTAIVMSTHLMGIAERLCHRLVIMDKGKIAADVSQEALHAITSGGAVAIEEFYLAHVSQGDHDQDNDKNHHTK